MTGLADTIDLQGDPPLNRHADEECPLWAALDLLGERWAILILRDAFNGIQHFEDFQTNLGIARNILSDRLAKLVQRGVLDRRPSTVDRRKVEYQLTAKGAALFPALVALRQWGESWECSKRATPGLIDRKHGKPVQRVQVMADDGRALAPSDVLWTSRQEEDK